MADKWQMVEEEVKLLKNEIKQVLIDIKERLEGAGTLSSLPANTKKITLGSAEKASEEAVAVRKEEPGGNGKVAPEALALPEKDNAKVALESVAAGGNGKAAHADIATPINRESATMNRGAVLSQRSEDSVSAEGPRPLVGERPPNGADLLTISMLSRWLANGVQKVGKQRMEMLIGVYSQLGGFTPEISDALMKLLKMDGGDGQAMKEGVSVLVEVDNLLRRSLSDRSEAAILSLFLSDKPGAFDLDKPRVYNNGNGNGNGNGKSSS